MFRLIRLLIATAVVILIIGGALFWFVKVSILERALSYALNSDIRFESVALSWNKVTLNQFRMAHAGRTGFQAERITIETSPIHLLKSPIYLDRVKIVHPILTVEIDEKSWPPLFPKGERLFSINELSLINLQLKIGQKILLPPIPYLELENLEGTLSQIEQLTAGYINTKEKPPARHMPKNSSLLDKIQQHLFRKAQP